MPLPLIDLVLSNQTRVLGASTSAFLKRPDHEIQDYLIKVALVSFYFVPLGQKISSSRYKTLQRSNQKRHTENSVYLNHGSSSRNDCKVCEEMAFRRKCEQILMIGKDDFLIELWNPALLQFCFLSRPRYSSECTGYFPIDTHRCKMPVANTMMSDDPAEDLCNVKTCQRP